MKLNLTEKPLNILHRDLKAALAEPGMRLGHVTSLAGGELVTLVLDTTKGEARCWLTPLEESRYTALTCTIPQAHWCERILRDMFGIIPEGHPRLKHVLIHDAYMADFHPLRKHPLKVTEGPDSNKFQFMQVGGEGVYEVPVGPIHAGVIEPAHFRCSCLGEVIVNLELRLGYVHRGVEKRLTEVPWRKARYVAEATASDTTVAHALAHSIAIESLFGFVAPPASQYLRSIALEIERLAVHIIDIGGIAMDTGLLGIAQTMSRLRGKALSLGDMLAGSRFLRAYVCPGGVARDTVSRLTAIATTAKELKNELAAPIAIMEDSQVLRERCEHIGLITPSLAREFGLVGVAGRAAGIAYDVRHSFEHGVFPMHAPTMAVQQTGDIWARTAVRIAEIWRSLDCIIELAESVPYGSTLEALPDKLPANSASIGIVEAFRGELIHMIFTDEKGNIQRYCLKDPSMNNWTAIPIGIRNNLIADFPLCNKSFALAYSGHDL
jgi:Ni,Fe-hydrogenase III large subunit